MSFDQERQSLQLLYNHHHGWLQDWLRRKLGDAADAADVAQDTFMRIMTAPEHIAEKQSGWQLKEPRAYLTVVAKRLMANLYRRRALEQAYLDSLAMMPELPAPSPEHKLLILETLQQIDNMLDGLPGKVRAAFLMAQLDGMTYAQVAKQLAVSERTVKRYMVQAMARCIMFSV
ncbi:sigma-70 family RNA polymerase sigma factor [Methylobacillus arboreus]|uniref:sigma-70 family RNA polymerase sigma factor n=1 Tax=Methylobacillus arboreus TaxID=755170 RepID=UPI001E3C715E|nr:sigma-70 family RNA polymerase sigma factor [Methylobacillus arboreus]MCB5190109.1 sigma-70 family RNA polymerase sigma factor [Methylobacillus arboreus]